MRLHAGAAYWLGAGRSRPIAEGEVWVVAPGSKALVRASVLNEVVCHGFALDPNLLYGFFTLAEQYCFQRAVSTMGEVRFFPSTDATARRFAELVASWPDAQSLAHRVGLLGIIAAAFQDILVEPSVAKPRLTAAANRFQELIVQLPASELMNYTVHQLAELCRCSPRQFSRLFKARFGTSARVRQTELRLLRARELLSTSKEEVRRVALGCGYRNLSLFNSLFRRRFGLTPTDWREQSNSKGVAHSSEAEEERK
jgi:AraC-like DNA-binding protein